MPTKRANVARLAKDQAKAEQHTLRCCTQVVLLDLLHGQSLTVESVPTETIQEMETHYLRVLIHHLLRLRTDNKHEELVNAIDQIHPTYLPTVIDHLTPMAVEACSEDEAMPGQ